MRQAFLKEGINPETGRKCKLHMCSECLKLFPKNKMRADHIDPVVDPRRGFVDWNTYIERMFVEVEGFMALCEGCHDIKTKEERAERSVN